MRFIQNMFISVYEPTIEDSYTKIIKLDNEEIQLEIIDTSGTESFMRDYYFKNADGFLLVYSINSRSSFDEILEIHEQIKLKKPIFIVGNKCDLEDRCVSRAQGLSLARALNAGWSETSAYSLENVKESFTYLVSEIISCQTVDLLLFNSLQSTSGYAILRFKPIGTHSKSSTKPKTEKRIKFCSIL